MLFSRHYCTRTLEEHAIKKNDVEWNEIDLEQEHENNFMNIDINNPIKTTGGQVESNNDGEGDEDELNDEEVSEEVFYKLFEEASFFDEEIPPESQDDNKGAQLVRSICLFLSYWQYSFNITDSALEFVLKFLKLFF